ncbi:hypothetical protein L6164_022272 [Bauhinia variegata]|uniref:Uncharacterized protein n=1 Tax=Bauhinia variegata TaxID=167791 RepID=A0ACB9MI11_BAUVA|nr:hypothetical protein L6164_022272 [Bauhinia variegata]
MAPEVLGLLRNAHLPPHSDSSRSFCSFSSNIKYEGPTAIDYGVVNYNSLPNMIHAASSVMQEDEFHRLADSTIHDLQEKFEVYGDSIEVDGFDIDYGNDVLTLKLGDLGTYVLNKQTPNRQIWLSSPVSPMAEKSNLYIVLECELEQLCGKPLLLSLAPFETQL